MKPKVDQVMWILRNKSDDDFYDKLHATRKKAMECLRYSVEQGWSKKGEDEVIKVRVTHVE